MIQFDWNTLRTGDPIVVHEHVPDSYLVAVPGDVAFVFVRKQGNEVGIRVATPTGSRVLWPTRFEVHAPTDAETAGCPSCTPLAVTSSPALAGAEETAA